MGFPRRWATESRFAATLAAIATPALAQHDHNHGEAPPAAAAASAPAGAQGVGVIKSVDAKAGTITLHHGPIAALNWPAMTMTFKAAPDALKAAKPGATVTFTLNAAADEIVSLQ